MKHFEIETTLAVCSGDPESIARQIAALTSVGEFALLPRRDLAIRDAYLDFPDGRLRACGLALRMRVVNGRQLVTLKGRPQRVGKGGVKREELELQWSEVAFETLMARLAESGLTIDHPPIVDVDDGSLAVFLAIGFEEVQTRDTVRRIRDVVAEDRGESPIAELAIDSVTYRFSFGDVRHHEVEIELKGQGSVDAMQAISRELLALRPSDLRTWGWGKKATGQAVEWLANEGGLDALLSEAGNLTPAAYDLIAARLQ